MQIGLLLLGQILEFFFMIFLGYLIVRMGLLKSEDSQVLSILVVYLVMPCVIIKAFQIESTPEKLKGMIFAFAAAIVVHLIFLALIWIFRRIMGLDEIEMSSVMYSNAGNMIVPIVGLLLGDEWLLYSSAYISVQIILLWTHCKRMICGEKGINLMKILGNVNLLAIIAGILLFILNRQLPYHVSRTVSMFSNMLAPLSMVITGMIIAGSDLKRFVGRWRIYLVALLRLVICPVVLLSAIYFSEATKWIQDGNVILLITFL